MVEDFEDVFEVDDDVNTWGNSWRSISKFSLTTAITQYHEIKDDEEEQSDWFLFQLKYNISL